MLKVACINTGGFFFIMQHLCLVLRTVFNNQSLSLPPSFSDIGFAITQAVRIVIVFGF